MALMVTDTYDPKDQRIFRDGMGRIDEATRKAHNVAFMQATPQQRLAVLEALDREQKTWSDARQKAQRERDEQRRAAGAEPGATKSTQDSLPDEIRPDIAVSPDYGAPTEITADAPAHYFRMMKELALLGYFTSEIGYTQAMRYIESPGRFDPCTPYTAGEKIWADHA
jgi:hypothetical protein